MMKRRQFLLTAAGGMLLPAAGAVLAAETKKADSEAGAKPIPDDGKRRIGEWTPEQLLEYHFKEITVEYLPVWRWRGIDHEYGGFLWDFNEFGEYAISDKEFYYQGRGFWMVNRAYNDFGQEPYWLEAANKSKEFFFRNALFDDMFVDTLTREGEVKERIPNIYGDIYMAMGLAEHYKATGDEAALEQGIRTALSVFERATSPTYEHNYKNHGAKGVGVQRLGTWVHLMSALVPLLRHRPDHEGLKKASDHTVDMILHKHYDAKRKVGWENLPFDLQPAADEREGGSVSAWHALQGCWLVMDEGLRRGDRAMFREGHAMGQTYLPSLLTRTQSNGIGRYSDDLLLYALVVLEHTEDAEAEDAFTKTLNLGFEQRKWDRRDLYHHPRRLFYAHEILKRIVARGGERSDFLA